MAGTRGPVAQHGRLRAVTLTLATMLAMAATAVMVLSDDPRMLRLGVLAALWAFLVATIGARRPPEDDGESSDERELRRAYEMELDREIAARREYELRLELQLRRELDASVQHEVETLRHDLVSLHRDIVDQLTALPSRAALHATATRLVEAGAPLALPSAAEPDDAEQTGTGWAELPNNATEEPEDVRSRRRRYREDDSEDTLSRLLAGEDQASQTLNGAEGPRRRRYREDGEDNEVLSRVLGR